MDHPDLHIYKKKNKYNNETKKITGNKRIINKEEKGKQLNNNTFGKEEHKRLQRKREIEYSEKKE